MQIEIARALDTLRKGGPESLERALVYLQGTIFSFSLKVCGNRADAEDTMQETLFRLLPYMRRFEHPEALGVWLYNTARKRCLMSRRRSKYAPRVMVPLGDSDGRAGRLQVRASPAETPEALAIRREGHSRLYRAVLKLPPPYRDVLVLEDIEGLSTAETAMVLGLSTGTVRVRRHRARIMLRNELESREALSLSGSDFVRIAESS